MAKLKNSFGRSGQTKLPSLGSSSGSVTNSAPITTAKDGSTQTLQLTKAGSVVQALNFGTLHTKATGSNGGSGWGSLLSTATSGSGISSVLGGGLLSSGTLGFVGKLLNLFGGGSSTPSAPTPFVLPASQASTVNVGTAAPNSASLGVQANISAGNQNGPIYHNAGATAIDHATQSTQVVQIVKQALLTSSSLNDVISEV